MSSSLSGTAGGSSSQDKACEAAAEYLDRVLSHATPVDDELQRSKAPSYPINDHLVQSNCQVLLWLLGPVIPLPGATDVSGLEGYGVAPATLASFFATHGRESDMQAAFRWLADLSAKLRDATTRPGDDVVTAWHGATNMLRKAVTQAIEQDLSKLAGNPAALRDDSADLTELRAELAACLKSAPDGDCTTDQVKAWLFTSQNCVAVRVCRTLEDKAARELLTEVAGRSWRQCTAGDSEPQRLWRDLGASFARIAAEDERASVRVGPFPKDRPLAVNLLPAALLDGSRTVRALAGECRDFCAAPLLTPSDLICPFPQVSLPYYEPARQWQDSPQAVGFFCKAQQVPVGDFIPASIIFRLKLMTELRFVLRSEWAECAEIDHEYKGFANRASAIHGRLWATPDAEARNGAMALLQMYLAGGKPGVVGLMGYEADWSILPGDVPKLLDMNRDRPMDSHRRIEALGLPPTFGERHGRLKYIVLEAVKTRPGEVASIVKGGLEWLASSLAAMGDDFADLERLPPSAGEPVGGQHARGKPAPEEPSDDSTLSPRKLADVYGVPRDALRKRLERLRKEDHTCFVEVADRTSKEPQFLYYVGKVRHVIEDMNGKAASSETSSKRPAKKITP